MSPSKVSRLETGQRGASERDINDLCDLYEVGDEQRQHLLELASEGKQRAWWQSFALPYSTYVGLEAEATSISDYGLGMVPGLLQTADYAPCRRPRGHPHPSGPGGGGSARIREDCQAPLPHSDNATRFEAVVDDYILIHAKDKETPQTATAIKLEKFSAIRA